MSELESKVEALASNAQPDSAYCAIKKFLPRGLIVLASLAIAAFVFLGCRALWREWVLLQDAVADVQATAPVGFLDIAPVVSFATASRKSDSPRGQ